MMLGITWRKSEEVGSWS